MADPTSNPSFGRPPTRPVFPARPSLALPRRGRANGVQGQAVQNHDGFANLPATAGSAADELAQWDKELTERERAVEERESRLAEQQRDLAEAQILLQHHTALLEAAKKAPARSTEISPEERAALTALKEELDRREIALQESRDELREREHFIETSESRLFEKVQEQQEKETELEQREDDLRTRLSSLGVDVPPVKKAFDEFSE